MPVECRARQYPCSRLFVSVCAHARFPMGKGTGGAHARMCMGRGGHTRRDCTGRPWADLPIIETRELSVPVLLLAKCLPACFLFLQLVEGLLLNAIKRN